MEASENFVVSGQHGGRWHVRVFSPQNLHGILIIWGHHGWPQHLQNRCKVSICHLTKALSSVRTHLVVFLLKIISSITNSSCPELSNTLSSNLARHFVALHLAKQPKMWCCCKDFWFPYLLSCIVWGLKTFNVQRGSRETEPRHPRNSAE